MSQGGRMMSAAHRTVAGQVDRLPLLEEQSDGQLRGLLAISRRMKQAKPVFIVGEARSGTTILFRTLLKHPVFEPRVENLQESSFVVQAPQAGDFNHVSPRNLRRFMLDDERAWQRFLQSIRPIRWWLGPAKRLGPSFGVRWAFAPSRLVARSFVFHARQARGCRRLLEKTPNHVNHVPRLLACFPEARILYIHRHPADVYSSYVRRSRVDPKADWARIGPHQFCRIYRRHTRRILKARHRWPEAVRLVRYGDFTAFPEIELESICGFLGIAYEPDVLSELDDPRQWAHWERSRHLYDGIKMHTKNWRDYLGPDDAAFIQVQLKSEMETLGHDPYDPGKGAPAAKPAVR